MNHHSNSPNFSFFFKVLLISYIVISFVFAQTGKVKGILNEAEKLHEANNFPETMVKLKEAEKLDKDNPEILWKIARGYFDFADQDPENLDVQKKNLYPGFEYAKRCVELAPNVAGGHQYYAILIGRIGEIEGTKQKIQNSYPLREHTMKAIELDPKNDGNYHVMGRWHYALADLSWAERKIASLIYAKPPAASFDEAAKFFQKAHDLKPDDIRHMLWLGKTYIKLDQNDLAKKALNNALKIKAESGSDKVMQTEARKLLEKL